MSQTSRVVVLVPRREGIEERDRIWEYIKPHWEAIGPVYEGHHTEGIWNRAAAINRAAREAGDWDYAVIIDADTIVPAEQVAAAVEYVSETGELAVAFRRCFQMDEEETEKAMATGELPGKAAGSALSCSRCVVVDREFWDRIGGMDEKFVGWAGEDLALWTTARKTVGARNLPGDAWHFWHPPDPTGSFDHPCYKANLKRVRLYAQTGPEDIIALARGTL